MKIVEVNEKEIKVIVDKEKYEQVRLKLGERSSKTLKRNHAI